MRGQRRGGEGTSSWDASGVRVTAWCSWGLDLGFHQSKVDGVGLAGERDRER